MSVTGRRLNLRVAQQLSDHRQPLAERQCARGKSVSEVVDPNVVQLGPCSDAPPRVLLVGEVAVRLGAGLAVRGDILLDEPAAELGHA